MVLYSADLTACVHGLMQVHVKHAAQSGCVHMHGHSLCDGAVQAGVSAGEVP